MTSQSPEQGESRGRIPGEGQLESERRYLVNYINTINNVIILML